MVLLNLVLPPAAVLDGGDLPCHLSLLEELLVFLLRLDERFLEEIGIWRVRLDHG
jgi:hypothetical protein